MLRIIAPSIVLSVCFTLTASAQYLEADVGCGHSHSHCPHDACYDRYPHDSYSSHQHAPDSHYNYHHVGYHDAGLNLPHAIPVFIGTDCPYRNDGVCSESIGCPLQRGRGFPNQLNEGYRPDFGPGYTDPNHPHGEGSHNGHSHEGHSHDDHSHEGHSYEGYSREPIPGNDITPFYGGNLTPLSQPPSYGGDLQTQPDFRQPQLQRDDSLRTDNPLPSTDGRRTPSSPNSVPNIIDTPPPSTL